jgi:hypothetical protein
MNLNKSFLEMEFFCPLMNKILGMNHKREQKWQHMSDFKEDWNEIK